MAKQTLDFNADGNKQKEQNEKKSLSSGTVLIEWEAPEYVVYKKTVVWYVGFGVILALLIFSAFVMQSFLTAIVFILAGILIFVYSERKPKIISYDIRTSGIRVDSRVFLFRELESFNTVERGSEVYLLLKSKRVFMPMIHIPLNDADHELVTETLGRHLSQDPDFVEPFADIIAHWLGF